MERQRDEHPDLAALHQLVDGEVAPIAMLPLARHLEACNRCRVARERIEALNQDLDRLPAAEEPEGFTSQVLARVAGLPAPRRRARTLRLILPAGLGAASALAFLLLPSGGRMLAGFSRLVRLDLMEPSRLLEILAGVASAVVGGVGRAVDGLARPVPFVPWFDGAAGSNLVAMMVAAVLLLGVSSMIAFALAGRGVLRARSRRT